MVSSKSAAKSARKRAADFMNDDGSDSAGGVRLANDNVSLENEAKAKSSDRSRKRQKKPLHETTSTVNGLEPPVETKTKSFSAEPNKKIIKSQSTVAEGRQKSNKREKKHDQPLHASKAKTSGEENKASNTNNAQRDSISTAMQIEAQGVGNKVADDLDDTEKVQRADSDAVELAPELLAGFDSDSADQAEDEGIDQGASTPTIPNYKKTNKKLRQVRESGKSEGPGTVYVGRVPHGFFEHQMRAYFSQFGEITKLRLSRNRVTGASKHFAFIQFKHAEVAKIVAQTMDNYLMFGHILKCKFAPEDTLHADIWKGANRRYRRIPHNKLEKTRLEKPKSAKQWQNKITREQQKRETKAEKLKAIGYNIELPKLTNVDEIVKEKTDSLAQQTLSHDSTSDKMLAPATTLEKKQEEASKVVSKDEDIANKKPHDTASKVESPEPNKNMRKPVASKEIDTDGAGEPGPSKKRKKGGKKGGEEITNKEAAEPSIGANAKNPQQKVIPSHESKVASDHEHLGKPTKRKVENTLGKPSSKKKSKIKKSEA
ncbi:MAG: hypothetical protein Q9227_006477 [Pyrenula ochraceoflavens]